MELKKYKFIDLLQPDKGVMKGPFGGDIKKEFFVPKSADTYKVYEQSVVYNKNHRVGKYYISSERFSKLKRFEVKPKDILVSGAGTLGDLYELPEDIEPGIINQALIRLRINENIVDRGFFKYYFSWYIKVVACRQIGASVIPNFPPIEDLKKITVLLPDLATQHKIASVLSVLDSKIALNRAINRNLEALAKQLYDYWFVQFDFPDENARPYKSSGGKMVWNEVLKREIPIAWKSGAFSDIANITMGQSPDGSSYNEKGEGIVFYQGSTDFGILFPSVRMYTTSPSRYAKQGDILMSVRAPVGAVNIANSDCCIGRGLSAINSKKGSVTYIYYVIHYLKVRFDSLNTAGTTFGSITKDELFSLPVVIPSEKILERFEAICKPIFNKQMEIGFEIESLTRQRDELLPLLMNGQITVNSDLSAR